MPEYSYNATPLLATKQIASENIKLLAKGKVRDIYELVDNKDYLLFIATDRISAYDVIMKNGIPEKGKLLTQLSKFWFKDILKDSVRNHLYIDDNDKIKEFLQIKDDAVFDSEIRDRCLIVKKHDLIPLECIVRGYITGSGWKEYKKDGTIHGMEVLPKNKEYKQCEKLETPMFTPSTKAEQGMHDENISIEKAIEILNGDVKLMKRIEDLALKLYSKAHDYALTRGIIIADTKFEFGYDKATDEIILVDEVLTPDSSRFWSQKTYEIGRDQDSYDKQFLRNWLTATGVAGQDGISMPEDIVKRTFDKYKEAYEVLAKN
ncbi:SAICAR synthetase [Hanseniaspora valbyensis NRRL Y-1626]|uniref:Phosphoribosylaminoimidazole-succinocarboxamide synthase n=1 Tax=Hanseniaspora valbyensis NRRL Y-1626 TaxID=766949 RepID=A0A1B7TI40_9ASCO|nr:SAICAR synthetase [Hanseniaspora valbyensis NRRL Y-1626]